MAVSAPEWQHNLRTALQAQVDANAGELGQVIRQYRSLAKRASEIQARNEALLQTGGPEGSAPTAYLNTLETQLTTLRTELSALYKTQASSQVKQLAMADHLRERDEAVRDITESNRALKEKLNRLERREKEWEERWKMREVDLVTLHDELLSLNLELTNVTARNASLQADNAALLQRWLDKMNIQADEMNDEFESEAATKEGFRKGGKE